MMTTGSGSFWGLVRKEWRPAAAGLLSLLLLFAATPPLAPPLASPGTAPRWEEYGRMISLEPGGPFLAFLFRILVIVLLTLFFSGLVLNLQGLIRGEWWVFPRAAPPRADWGVGAAARLALYFITILLVFSRLQDLVFSFSGLSPQSIQPWILLGNAVFQFGLLLGLTAIFLKKFRSAPPPAFPAASVPPPEARSGPGGRLFPRLGPGELALRVRQALRGYICFFPLLVLLIAGAWVITRFLGLGGQPHPLVQPLLDEGRPVLIWPLLFVGVLVGPLAEEIFFRGVLFPPLLRRVGGGRAAAITAALFATLHFNWAGWLPIFGLGLLLARSYQRTGSLLVPFFIHALHNGLFLTFTILVYRIT